MGTDHFWQFFPRLSWVSAVHLAVLRLESVAFGDGAGSFVSKMFQRVLYIYVGMAKRWASCLTPSARSDYYFWIFGEFTGEFRFLSCISGPSPAIFAYCVDIVLYDDAVVLATWHISITEYVVITLGRFLGAAHDNAVSVCCIDPWIGRNDRESLVPSPSRIAKKSVILAF